MNDTIQRLDLLDPGTPATQWAQNTQSLISRDPSSHAANFSESTATGTGSGVDPQIAALVSSGEYRSIGRPVGESVDEAAERISRRQGDDVVGDAASGKAAVDVPRGGIDMEVGSGATREVGGDYAIRQVAGTGLGNGTTSGQGISSGMSARTQKALQDSGATEDVLVMPKRAGQGAGVDPLHEESNASERGGTYGGTTAALGNDPSTTSATAGNPLSWSSNMAAPAPGANPTVAETDALPSTASLIGPEPKPQPAPLGHTGGLPSAGVDTRTPAGGISSEMSGRTRAALAQPGARTSEVQDVLGEEPKAGAEAKVGLGNKTTKGNGVGSVGVTSGRKGTEPSARTLAALGQH
ncbi:hypothetical protein DACRYDRAFT_99768 [Dacryopinax primogenitus]|uniref:SMP domain-containing protein n=1 Tax=Dacryopinax primogenitus (strain DJM 731) TaxID=1858805 RepID=M5G238_DACPD|nr:uncharacterized protein DACRYDRAFT_99768 [Dacryopinax primogenitus]EJU02754.1 hypothetical protein DACRYDRAFT_99768 [Dacryopinax primogenitus]